MRISPKLFAVTTGVVALWSCSGGGSGSSSSTPTSPSATPAATVTIVGSTGSAAFVPNPMSAASGSAIAWKNNDAETHHIVLDDGSGDTGEVAPGATSRSLTVRGSDAVSYHCTLHPTMVGSINGASAPSPPPDTTVGYGRARS